MKRMIDILLAAISSAVFAIPMLLIALLVKKSSPGPVLYWSDRVGRNNTIFRMPKFRTMKVNTPPKATHLLTSPEQYLTEIGAKLRKYSLDELPQIISVLKGDMSFVGPRPALFNQDDLVALRTQKSIHTLVPGITGWAQVNGRDDLPIPKKVELDEYYFHHRSFFFDLNVLVVTFYSVLRRRGVQH
jgi:O-antigen biosynthesis protein WbqP